MYKVKFGSFEFVGNSYDDLLSGLDRYFYKHLAIEKIEYDRGSVNKYLKFLKFERLMYYKDFNMSKSLANEIIKTDYFKWNVPIVIKAKIYFYSLYGDDGILFDNSKLKEVFL